jgi:hypothetical protein
MKNNSEYFTRTNVYLTSSTEYRYWIAIKNEGAQQLSFHKFQSIDFWGKNHFEELC